MIRKHLYGIGALVAALAILAPVKSHAVGDVTSRLTTAKFALMKGWYGTDHNSSTPGNFKWMATIMASSGISVDTFSLTSSVAPLTQTNLDKYDVIVWYNVYRMYEHFDSTTGNRIQRWYESNKGLACYHQCVRSSSYTVGTTTIPWTWWINMMGKDYNTYAGSGITGPVYVDSQAVNTVYNGLYTGGQSFSWNDEWYTYVGNPRGLPGTKMMWTTKASAFASRSDAANWNMGEDHPLAWIRDFGGGRFSLNGMFHSTVVSTATGAQRIFFDSSYIGTMRFLAGYNGCKDSNYVEYNAKATHQAVGACVNPTFIKIGKVGDPSDKMRVDDFKIRFSQPGFHSVDIFNTAGSRVASQRGEGTQEYRFSEIRQPGVYYVRVMTADMKTPYTRRVMLL